MPDPEATLSQLLDRLQGGDRAAADGVAQHYLPRLLGLARRTLAGRNQRPADAEDAVQSALLSFWRRLSAGEFRPPFDRDNLWSLLGLITVRKALKHAARERALKRGGGLVRGESDLAAAGADFRLEDALPAASTQEFDLHCEELLLQLDEALRPFAVLKLLGHSTKEIAQLQDCTERKVQRKLELVRLHWERACAD